MIRTMLKLTLMPRIIGLWMGHRLLNSCGRLKGCWKTQV